MDFPLGTSTNTFSKPNGDSNDLLIHFWSELMGIDPIKYPPTSHIYFDDFRELNLRHGDFAEGHTCPCPCPLGPWRMPLAPPPLLGKLSDHLLDHWKGIHRRWNYGTMGVFTASKRCNPRVFPCWWFDYMCSNMVHRNFKHQQMGISTASDKVDAWLMIRDDINLYNVVKTIKKQSPKSP